MTPERLRDGDLLASLDAAASSYISEFRGPSKAMVELCRDAAYSLRLKQQWYEIALRDFTRVSKQNAELKAELEKLNAPPEDKL
jgi:hypothetical protein